MEHKEFTTLLRFFKALSNENRLKIIGILAERECSVEELAALLDLKAPTVTHHLRKLKELGLVDMRIEGNDHIHRLNLEGLQVMNRNVLTIEKVTSFAEDTDYDTWERKVLSTFLDGDQVKSLPMGYKKRLAVLKWLVNRFAENRKYTEKEINGIIERHHPDYCTIRREFVEYGLMKRENGKYWRVEWKMPDLSR